MPSLEDLLKRTMLFTAARDSGHNAYVECTLGASDSCRFAAPTSLGPLPAADRQVWGWDHDGSTPAKVTNLRAFAPACNMAMTACESIEVKSVSVTIDGIDGVVSLPLTTKFVLAKYSLLEGKIKQRTTGWWQLEANTDPSLLVVFGYELPRLVNGGSPTPLSLADIEKLGWRFFPTPDVVANDPDAPVSPVPGLTGDPFAAGGGQKVTAYVAPFWVIVAFGLTTCKQRADFEPGGVLGAGRVYPHVMVTSNQRLGSAETTIAIVRPAKTMAHDSEMDPSLNIGGILVADTNSCHAPLSRKINAAPPLPLWSNFFDYYDLSPPVGTEFTMVDPARSTRRIVPDGILREAEGINLGSAYESSSPFPKLPRQGDYDSVHLAPRMQFSGIKVKIPGIAMAPFCIHDCFHTHFRWGSPLPEGVGLPVSNRGFVGRQPYREDGAPLVPPNQTVFVTLTSPNAILYRATAAKPIVPGTWTVFCHHGSAYALEIADNTKFALARNGVAADVGALLPMTPPGPMPIPVFNPTIFEPDPRFSVAGFYQWLQFMGGPGGSWLPRIKILDLKLCRTK